MNVKEKSLLGVASLLKGIPGVQFTASDLVRNFVMSTALGKYIDYANVAYLFQGKRFLNVGSLSSEICFSRRAAESGVKRDSVHVNPAARWRLRLNDVTKNTIRFFTKKTQILPIL